MSFTKDLYTLFEVFEFNMKKTDSFLMLILILVLSNGCSQQSEIPSDVAMPEPWRITEDEDGQKLVKDEIIVILEWGTPDPKKRIREIAASTDGKIIGSVPETLTYQLRFNVKDLESLEKKRLLIESLPDVKAASQSYLGETRDPDIDKEKVVIIEDLIQGNKKISFPRTEIGLSKEESEILKIGIRNIKDTPLRYKFRFTPISGPNGTPFSVENPQWFYFNQNYTYTLPSAEVDIRSIRLAIPIGVTPGSYSLTFDVLDEDLPPPDNIYAQTEFSIVVMEDED